MTVTNTLKDWFETFWKILILPTSGTFSEESEKAKGKFSSAIGWAIFIAIYSFVISIIAGINFNADLFIIAMLIFPILVVLLPSATHFVLQRFFHQKQYLYDRLLYIFTAILVLFQLIITPVTFFAPSTIVRLANYFVIAYQLVLFIIAIKSIARIKYWQAIITTIITAFAGILIFICTLPVIFSLIGSVSSTMR